MKKYLVLTTILFCACWMGHTAQALAGSISGTVYAVEGAGSQPLPLYGQWGVKIYDAATRNYINGSSIEENGTYTIADIPAGAYKLSAEPSTNHVSRYYSNAIDFDSGETISINDNDHLTGYNFTLEPGGIISGTVYESDGVTPVHGNWGVKALKASDHHYVDGSEMASDGTYSIKGLPADSYIIYAIPSTNHIPEYYDNVYTPNDAQIVNVSIGQSISNIDFQLGMGGVVSGHVYALDGKTPIENASVDINIVDQNSTVARANTDAQGFYSIPGLKAGNNYKVEVAAAGYLRAFYVNTPRWETATPISVQEGNETSGIDVELIKADSAISGKVVYQNGDPAAHVWMEAFHQDGWFVGLNADENGVYSIPVIEGNWQVFPYEPPHEVSPVNVAVASKETVQNINFTFDSNISDNLDLTPAVDLDGYGAATWSNEYGTGGLDISCNVIDHNGVDSQSHTVTITFPDGQRENIPFSSSKSATCGEFYLWKSLNEDELQDLAAGSRKFIFTATDDAQNTGTAVDILDINPLAPPDMNSFSVTANGTSPTFKWNNAVNGADGYRVRIYSDDLSRTVWSKFFGLTGEYTAPPGILHPNTSYRYRIQAWNGHLGLDIDNASAPAHKENYPRFTTGQESTEPFIDNSFAGVQTWNTVDEKHILSPYIIIHHAKGVPASIKTVTMRFPDYTAENGREIPLYFNYNESGTAGIYEGESFDPNMISGTYTFIVEDVYGNITRYEEHLALAPLPVSENWKLEITPQPEGDGTGYHYSWDPVNGAVYYRVEIYDDDFNRVYTFGTEHNEYDLAPGFFKKHELYRHRITARTEFFEMNVSNGVALPWASVHRPAMTAVPLTGGVHTPNISLAGWGAVLYHYPDPFDDSDRYYLGFWVEINDNDGVPSNIQSVTANFQGQTVCELFLDSDYNDNFGGYWGWIPLNDIQNIDGTYTFTVVDADGKTAQITDEFKANPMPLPGNLKPADKDFFYGTSPVIQWDPVAGASLYRVRLYNGLWKTIHRSGYFNQNHYTVPENTLNENQIFSYRIRACRENFFEDGVDLDNISMSDVFAKTLYPHVSTRSLDLGGSILSLQVLSGNTSERINSGADINGDGAVGLQEAIQGLLNTAK